MSNRSGRPVAVVGYSGHSYVVIDIFISAGRLVTAYCDQEKKENNPYQLTYLGRESEAIEALEAFDYFPCVGDNRIREKIVAQLSQYLGDPATAIHRAAVVSPAAMLGTGVMIAANATLNPLVKIGNGVICNTGSIIEHECIVGDFSHIAPGAVLCGNVSIGRNTFVGANAVIHQGVAIGNNVTIGAGSVVIRNVPDNAIVAGNPAQSLVK